MRYQDIDTGMQVKLTADAFRRYGAATSGIMRVVNVYTRPGYKTPLVELEGFGIVYPKDIRPA